MTGLQPSAKRMMPAIAKLQSALVTPVVKPAIDMRVLENNALFSAQKPYKVKDIQTKKIKDSPQKSISLIEERGVRSFLDN